MRIRLHLLPPRVVSLPVPVPRAALAIPYKLQTPREFLPIPAHLAGVAVAGAVHATPHLRGKRGVCGFAAGDADTLHQRTAFIYDYHPQYGG